MTQTTHVTQTPHNASPTQTHDEPTAKQGTTYFGCHALLSQLTLCTLNFGNVDSLPVLPGVVLCVVGICGILRHRHARWEIWFAAREQGGRCGATLREVFERLRSTHQNASVWKTMLQNAAGAVAATLTWNVVQIFIDIPAFCIGAVYSKVCGVYIFTAANFRRFGFFLQTAPLHCSVDDAFVLLRSCRTDHVKKHNLFFILFKIMINETARTVAEKRQDSEFLFSKDSPHHLCGS